ncbi:E3 ubiquitin-protein ligase dtx3l [Bonamia ostreae]|uniref:RING-type E3 ubiquitin transferase n=1 Tax=Bonamia ostreae TaxID=126728 RepID=A0ABV2AIT9_9EUKA
MNNEQKLINFCFPSFKLISGSPNFDSLFTSMTWQFSSRKGWINMDAVASYRLERALFENEKFVYIDIGHHRFSIDLANSTQTNLNTGNTRLIRRTRFFSNFCGVYDKSERKSEKRVEKIWVSLSKIEISNLDQDEKCSLCLDTFALDKREIGRLNRCKGHFFHKECGSEMSIVKYIDRFKKCPVCKEFYFPPEGRRPFGRMFIKRVPIALNGFNSDESWTIKFYFPPGKQSSLHSNPGAPYKGETRYAYLPDTQKGQAILIRFIKAWRKKLLFNVGFSISRQKENVIIYDGVHMKTSIVGGLYGYPDEGYLDRVSVELDNIGIK